LKQQGLDAAAAVNAEVTALKLQNISKIYPGTVALHKVNIEIRKGEVHGIIGRNGAGKSTLVEIIAGINTPTGGQIIFDDKSFDSLTRISARKKKIAFVPQEPQLILDFTVAENLFISDYTRMGKLINWPALYARAEKVVKKAGLNMNVRIKAGDLSISEQQLLLVLKACYVEEAQIIILDEASASLSQKDEDMLYRIIQERKKDGNTILFISHRADELLKVCDRVTVLRDGSSITTKDCADLDKDTLSALIVGTDSENENGSGIMSSPVLKETGDTVLSVENLTKLGVYHKITFDLRKGEILGLAGLRGSGRTEIFRGIIGIDPPDEGLIYVNGVKRRFAAPSEALKEGVVYLSEDREKEGLIKILSVRENLILNSLNKITKCLIVNRKKEKETVANLITRLDIKAASPEQEVSQLSGGNKQKVVVGKISAALPHVFLLDEPTKGVDISAKQGILNIIKNNLSKDAGIVITSPGLEDLINICDRILILFKGRITGEFLRGEFREGDLYLAIQGGADDRCS
jgi:ABC-type sugar transport system ATPase subunit